MTLYTIGYEGLSLEQFLALLDDCRVTTLVDVRELPLSRKRGFSKRSLAAALELEGITYRHIRALGCPKPVRNRYYADKDWQRYTKGYLAHLDTQTEALAELAELAETQCCALLCFEADFSRCHRSLVAAAVADRTGLPVAHITARGVRKETAVRGIPELASVDRTS